MIMEKALKGIIRIINAINEQVGKLTAWFTTVLVLLVGLHVLMRYQMDYNPTWITELEWHIFALIFLLGAGYSMKHDRHVRVDLFYTRFSEKDKALVNLIGTLFFLIPWCVLMIIYSFSYAMGAFDILEGSPNPGGLPARYLIKFAIPLGIGLLLLQAIAIVADSILKLRKTNS